MGNIYRRQSIHCEDLEELLGSISDIINFSSSLSFAGTLLNPEQKKKVICEIKSLSKEVVLYKAIKATTDSEERGRVYVFEVKVCWERNHLCVTKQESIEWQNFLQANKKDEVRIILIKSECMSVIEAKLAVYKKFKPYIDSENIFLLHEFEEYDEIAKLSARKKLTCLSDELEKLSGEIPLDLKEIFNKAERKCLTKEKIRDICYNADINDDDDNRIGTVYSSAYLCYSVFTVKKLKVILVRETLNGIGNSLSSEICNEILHHIKSNVKSSLVSGFAELQKELSENLYYSVKDIVITAIFFIFSSWIGLIVTVGMLFVTLVWPEDINSESWRQKVADEIYEKVKENKSAILEKVRPKLDDRCRETSTELKNVAQKVLTLRENIHVVNQEQMIEQWKKTDVLQFNENVSLEDCPTVLQCIAGHNLNGKEVIKVFLQGEKPVSVKEESTKEQLKRCFKCPDNYIFELVYVETKSKDIKEKNLEIERKTQEKNLEKRKTQDELVIDTERWGHLGDVIKRHSKKIFACFSNVVSIGISKERILENKIRDEACITLYCLDKDLVPFGEKKLPDVIDKCPCDAREDFVLFGTCPSPCQATDQNLPEPGCSIGIQNKNESGSVGFLVESNNPESFLSGFLTASHVAVEHIADIYNKTLLNTQNNTIIVHPSYEDGIKENMNSQQVGHVVESLCGDYESGGIDVAVVKTFKRESNDKLKLTVFNDDHRIPAEKVRVTKTGRSTGKTFGVLTQRALSVKVSQLFPNRRFFTFDNCYGVEQIEDTPFFEPGDSGAAVFVIDNDTDTPLGIAFAFSNTYTAVCRIGTFVRERNFYIVSRATKIQMN